MSFQHICKSPDETREVARRLAECVKPGDSIGLVGDLGAGKTLFVQGLAQGLDVPAQVRVTSPTFSLINEYRGGRLPLVHVDLYRIESSGELEHLGLDEMLGHTVVSAVEWPDRIEVLPTDHMSVHIEISSENTRVLRAEGHGLRSSALVSAWQRVVR